MATLVFDISCTSPPRPTWSVSILGRIPGLVTVVNGEKMTLAHVNVRIFKSFYDPFRFFELVGTELL